MTATNEIREALRKQCLTLESIMNKYDAIESEHYDKYLETRSEAELFLAKQANKEYYATMREYDAVCKAYKYYREALGEKFAWTEKIK